MIVFIQSIEYVYLIFDYIDKSRCNFLTIALLLFVCDCREKMYSNEPFLLI